MRVVTLGALGDSYSVYERGYSPLQERAGYKPSWLPNFNQDMRHRAGIGVIPQDQQGPLHPWSLWRTMTMNVGGDPQTWTPLIDLGPQAKVALWAAPTLLVLGGLAGYFAGKRWG